MHTVVTLVGIVVVVIAVAGLSSRFDLPSPLVLIVAGVVGSYLPFVPDVELRPEVVLFGLLPPLLYAASLQTSLVDFNTNRRPILLLSVGLVVFTTFGVGYVVHSMLPDIGWAPALAIGAVVAPPDAVAATTIGRRIGLPRRIVTILEGESLLNDATALVALNTAISATVAWYVVGSDFVIAAVGGVLVGLAFYVVIGFVRKHVVDATIDSALGFLTPFAAYVAAEEIVIPTTTGHEAHPSGVVAVVIAGLLLSHRAPVLQTAQSRIAERLNWRSIAFLLESSVFLLIGLQARTIIANAFSKDVGTTLVLLLCLATLVTVIVLRMLWVFMSRYLLVNPGLDSQTGKKPPWTYTFLLGWAGMRGVVTLAAAFVIPPETPYRDVLLLVAFAVTAGTLFLQGLTLPWFARRLRVPSPDAGADALARANLLHQASQAGLAELDRLEEEDPHSVAETIRDRVRRRDFAAWERVGSNEAESPSETYNRWRRLMLDKERDRVLEIRSSGSVPHEVIDEVLAMLDVEESMLDHSSNESDRVRAATPMFLEGDCEHLTKVRPPVEADTPGECGDCLREGTAWVHLRLCVVCGHVACCDSSPQRHASVHHEHTGHEVMRSAEPGERWRWCFVDEITG